MQNSMVQVSSWVLDAWDVSNENDVYLKIDLSSTLSGKEIFMMQP